MLEISVSFPVFFFFFLVVILHHRMLISSGRRNVRILLWYAIGLPIIFGIFMAIQNKFPDNISLPLTGGLIYILLSLLSCACLITPILGRKGPTATIQSLLRNGKSMSYRQILHYICDKQLIEERIEALIRSKMIKREKDRYSILPKGQITARLINIYSSLLNLETSSHGY